MIKPTAEELSIIRVCARVACRQQGDALHRIDVGKRFSLEKGGDTLEPSINILQVDKTRHWEESDLFDFMSWADLRKGIPDDGDGRAIIDLYCYARDTLSTNVQAVFDGGRLVWTGIDGEELGSNFGFTHWGTMPEFIKGLKND